MKRWKIIVLVAICLAWGTGIQAFAQTGAAKIKAFNEAAARDYLKEGLILAGEGRTEEALKPFRQALSIRPDWAEAHSLLGSALAETGHYKEAEAELRKAVALKPDYGEGWNYLGEFLKKQGKEQEAQEAFRKAQQYAH
jgi:Flp pilus assembly protein TadD